MCSIIFIFTLSVCFMIFISCENNSEKYQVSWLQLLRHGTGWKPLQTTSFYWCKVVLHAYLCFWSFILYLYNLSWSFILYTYLSLSFIIATLQGQLKALAYNFFFITMQSCAVLLPWLIIFVLNFLNSSLSFEIYLYLSWLQRCQRSTSDNFFFYCHAKLGSAHLIHNFLLDAAWSITRSRPKLEYILRWETFIVFIRNNSLVMILW